MDFKLVFATLTTIFVSVESVCLHNGCEMSSGLPAADIDRTINNLLNRVEYKDNVLKVITWNIHDGQFESSDNEWVTSQQDVCRFLTKMQPTILGLQDVNVEQLKYLESCMGKYRIIKYDEKSSRKYQNVVIFQKSKRLKLLNHGSFAANENKKNNPSTCTWVRLQFAERLTGRPVLLSSEEGINPNGKFEDRLSRLLHFLYPQNKSRFLEKKPKHWLQRSGGRSSIQYKWYNFYVAVVKINANSEEEAEKEFKSVLRNLKDTVMNRRRYPLLLLVDLGQEDNSLAYKYLKGRRSWLRNTMVHSIQSFPAMSKINENDPSSEMLSEYVWENRFHSVVGAVISDRIASTDGVSSNKPVFSAVLRHRRT